LTLSKLLKILIQFLYLGWIFHCFPQASWKFNAEMNKAAQAQKIQKIKVKNFYFFVKQGSSRNEWNLGTEKSKRDFSNFLFVRMLKKAKAEVQNFWIGWRLTMKIHWIPKLGELRIEFGPKLKVFAIHLNTQSIDKEWASLGQDWIKWDISSR